MLVVLSFLPVHPPARPPSGLVGEDSSFLFRHVEELGRSGSYRRDGDNRTNDNDKLDPCSIDGGISMSQSSGFDERSKTYVHSTLVAAVSY